jgi:hypothetical protein
MPAAGFAPDRTRPTTRTEKKVVLFVPQTKDRENLRDQASAR